MKRTLYIQLRYRDKERNHDETKHDNVITLARVKNTHIVEHGLWTINLETV